MRVVSGLARGRPLKGPVARNTRPMADRVKEALFSILENAMAVRAPAGLTPAPIGDSLLWEGLRALDLFAGTGALGIEALSRGAEQVDFVDYDLKSCQIINRNLALTGLTTQATIYRQSVNEFLSELRRKMITYHLIFLDPPYADADNIRSWLLELDASCSIVEEGLVAVGHFSRFALEDEYGDLTVVSRKKYGGPALTIFRRRLTRPEQEMG